MRNSLDKLTAIVVSAEHMTVLERDTAFGTEGLSILHGMAVYLSESPLDLADELSLRITAMIMEDGPTVDEVMGR
jgi:hypothetical protein